MSKLLLNEQPLLIMPDLATRIGLNESIVLQQIHYWLEINKKADKNYINSKYWTYNSYIEWQKQFPFWSVNTIKRTINRLEQLKLVHYANYNKLKIDRTKWYTINYEVLQALETSPLYQIGPTNVSEWVDHCIKLGLPLPENISKNISKTKNLHQHANGVDAYIDNYCKHRFNKQLRKANNIVYLEVLEDMEEREVYDFLDEHIETYEQCNLDYIAKIQHRAM